MVAYFGGYKLPDMTHGELEKFKQHRLAAPIVFERKTKEGKVTTKRQRTITSVNRELMAIRAMLRKAQREGWLHKTPFEEKDSLIRISDERRRETTLSYEEEARLLSFCVGISDDHLRPIIVCALSTGMRLGEIRFREVAAIICTSHCRQWFVPSRLICFSSMALSSLFWTKGGTSPISSRKRIRR